METLFQTAFPFWEGITKEQQLAITRSTRLQTFEKGQFLYYGGGQCAGLQLIKQGRVRVFLNSPNGGEITLYRLVQGDICILSAACMIKSMNLQVHMEMELDSKVYVIPGDVFKPLSDGIPAVKDFVLESVSARFSDVMWLMNQLVFSNMGQRLAQALLERSQMAQSPTLSITHDLIARDLGTAREVITRLLNQFQLDGLISLSRGKITLMNVEGLKAI